MPGPVNALSLDVEEWFQVWNLRGVIRREDWDRFESRVALGTTRFLELLAAAGARATFFFLGWVAERRPELVRAARDAGHEIACHGYDHRLLTEMSPDEFRADLRRTRDLLAALSGGPVLGYRAPSFSLRSETAWALDVLREEGFRYDSSVFPVRRRRYGMPQAPPHPYRHEGGLLEFPLLTLATPLGRLPAAGGGYLRLFPVAVIEAALRRMNAAGHPGVIYLHPWELDPAQPRLGGVPPLRAFLHRVNLSRTETKLRRLLEGRSFVPIGELPGSLARMP